MTARLRFATIELVAMAVLADIATVPTTRTWPADPVVQSTSVSLEPPLVRVRRVPGEPRTHFDDPAHLEYMCFGATFEEAQAIAEWCWRRFEFAYAQGYLLDDGAWVTVDRTESILPPVEVPWPKPDTRVFQGTHLIVTRAIRTA